MSKTMDSVFADCVDDELEFDILFEDIEDNLVDIVAGCNEAGVLCTEDFEGLTEAQLLEAEEIDDVEPEPETAEDEGCKKEAADVEPAVNTETKEVVTPKTGDNILFNVIAALLSLVVFSSSIIYIKKYNM